MHALAQENKTLICRYLHLEDAGCEKIYEEVVSGAKADRPVLNNLIKQLRDGDVIVVWKLDRLGRSLKHLVELVHILIQRNIGLCSLNDPIDTTTPKGGLFLISLHLLLNLSVILYKNEQSWFKCGSRTRTIRR